MRGAPPYILGSFRPADGWGLPHHIYIQTRGLGLASSGEPVRPLHGRRDPFLVVGRLARGSSYLSICFFFLSLSLLFSSSFLGNTMQLMLKLNRSQLSFEVL